MHRYLCLLLICTTATLPLSKTGLLVLFKVRQPYIAASLCEQRQVPNAKCQGYCFLAKKLKQETERETQDPTSPNKMILDLLAGLLQTPLEKRQATAARASLCSSYQLVSYVSPTPSIFHPPQL